jgi:hypothetical protein
MPSAVEKSAFPLTQRGLVLAPSKKNVGELPHINTWPQVRAVRDSTEILVRKGGYVNVLAG